MPPSSPIDISATMLPTTAPAAASRNEGTRYGTEAGSLSRISVFHQPAAEQRKYSVCTADGDFSPDVAPEILAEATNHLCAESPRVLLDLSLRLHWQLPERNDVPLFVLGAEGDRIANPGDVRATAAHHGVDATIVPGLAHMLMLERQWEKAARALLRWLATL